MDRKKSVENEVIDGERMTQHPWGGDKAKTGEDGVQRQERMGSKASGAGPELWERSFCF